MEEELWEAKGAIDSFCSRVRIVMLGPGEYVLEVLSRSRVSFLERLRQCLRYLRMRDFIIASVMLDAESLKDLRRVGELVAARENG